MIVVIAKKPKTELQHNIELVAKIKKELKNDNIAKEICKEYSFDIDIIDGISVEIVDDLDVSAKTVDSAIHLNSSLVDEDFNIIMRYAIHELVHALQHMKLVGLEALECENYLDRYDEVEAFQYQIKYDSKTRGLEEAEDYVDDLIEYHEVPDHKKEEKKDELMDRAS